ncbi:MAG: hypothetical protein AAFR91_13890 [Pseudomonadota bacterium]
MIIVEPAQPRHAVPPYIQLQIKNDLKGRSISVLGRQSLAESVIGILTVRGVPVSDVIRNQILGCDDLKQLKVWLERSVHAESAEDIFES